MEEGGHIGHAPGTRCNHLISHSFLPLPFTFLPLIFPTLLYSSFLLYSTVLPATLLLSTIFSTSYKLLSIKLSLSSLFLQVICSSPRCSYNVHCTYYASYLYNPCSHTPNNHITKHKVLTRLYPHHSFAYLFLVF